MKMHVFDIEGKMAGEIILPAQFNEDIRPDLIKRAVLAIHSKRRQPYGASKEAGKGYSVRLSKRRRDYRGSYGYGISRTPRKILMRRGRRLFWVGAFAPNTVGGRRAHPPKAEKIWNKKINKKERRKAIRSAITATLRKDIVGKRGHLIPENYPFIVDSKIESLKKTKELESYLKKLGFENELERIGKRKVRAGRGKARGRKYKTKKGPLIIISSNSSMKNNIRGIDIIKVNEVNAELLAPGAMPGRAALWTKAAIQQLEKQKLFM